MTGQYPLDRIAELVGGTVRGDGTVRVSGVADVADAGPSDLTFVSRPAYARRLADSRAGAVLVARDFGPTPMPAILCDRVERAVAQVLGLMAPDRSAPAAGVDPRAAVDSTARIAPDATVGPCTVIGARTEVGARTVICAGAVIGDDVRIGCDGRVGANVVIEDRCVLGDRVVLKAGAVIGGDGFGFCFDEGEHRRVPHIGTVVIEDDVEIGSCSCVDRAKFGQTRIERGVKIDNLVQVAHNDRVGEHTVIAAQTGLSGSVRVGRYCVLAGRSGAVDGVVIADRTTVGAVSVVSRSTTAGQTVLGFPAQDIRREQRVLASRRRLPELLEELRQLRARVKRLEAATDDQS